MPLYPPASSGGGAPTDATYVTQTANASLSAEQAMASLATGIVKNTTTTGVQSIAAAGTDYYAPGSTDVAVADGGTGSSTAAGAATNLGLGTGDSPQFTAVNIGAATDTTVTRTGAGDIAVEGNGIYRAGGTDVAVADGGSGASTLTGILKGNGTSAFTAVTAPSGAIVGDTDSQALTNKTIVGSSNTISAIPTSALILNGAGTNYVATAQTTTSTSYADLATTGPAVTVTIGASGMAMVFINAKLDNNTGGYDSHMSFAISGATTLAADDKYGIQNVVFGAAYVTQQGAPHLLTGLTPGSTTFTAKYRVGGNTGTFTFRHLSVIPL